MKIISYYLLIVLIAHEAGGVRMSDVLVQSHIEGLRSKDEAVRLTAARHLGSLGPRAVEAVPALVNAMEDADDEVALAVCEALKQIGKSGISHLLKFMRDTQEKEKFRWYAAEALADLGPESLPYLLKAMDDQDAGVQMMAIDSLPRVGIAAETAVQKIAEFLDNSNANLAQASAVSLAQIAVNSADPGTSLAMKMLLNASKSKDAALRRAIVSAFESVGDKISKIAPAIHALKEATQDQDKEVRDNAVWLLNRLNDK